MSFADYLENSIASKKSLIVAGFDPRPDAIPQCFHQEASKENSDEEFIYKLFSSFHSFALETLAPNIAAIKPNLAFFEAYGMGGLRAYKQLCSEARNLKLPIIADAKRGDIGSTAQAYAEAFLSGNKISNRSYHDFQVDALTINPFLGFDTLEVFLKVAEQHGKGLYVLVKTSNPGSGDLQNLIVDNKSISARLAEWVAKNADRLKGSNGLSAIGAVVGATYPEEAKALRKLMPDSLFLVPGYGAQGGSASEAVQSARPDRRGIIVNMSRGLLGSFKQLTAEADQLKLELQTLADNARQDLNSASV